MAGVAKEIVMPSQSWPSSVRSSSVLLAVLVVLAGCVSEQPSERGLQPSIKALTSTTTVSFQQGVADYAGTSDTTISEYYATTNYGAATTLTADGLDSRWRDVYALVRWDLASIPSHAVATAVTLTFRVTDASTAAYPVYALNRPFDEATATWNLAATGNSWATAGAKAQTDRNPTSVGSFSAAATGTRSVVLNSAGLAVVNGWLAAPATNHGFIVASTSNSDSVVFASSEHGTVSYRPQITITYEPPANEGTGGTGSGGAPGTGGATGAGGATGVDGGSGTGGSAGEGGAPATGGAGGSGGGSGFGFFVFSDSHVGSATNSYFSTALAQMAAIMAAAPVPTIAAISTGDHTVNGTSAEWGYHMALAAPYFDPVATAFGGLLPRYLAAMGNHDVMDAAWYGLWNGSFPGQQSLGTNSPTEGIYFSFTYGNALFVIRDTNTATNASTPGPQVTELQSLLGQSPETFKFVFHHKPAYYCGNGGLGMNKASLALLDAAALANADVVFTGHSHVYSRTCRMAASHVCSGNNTGTVQLEIGSVGTSTTRTLKTSLQTLTAYDASGVSRSYSYTCSTAKGYDKLLGSARTFVYVKIEGCLATLSAYQVGVGTPFDTWTISHCP